MNVNKDEKVKKAGICRLFCIFADMKKIFLSILTIFLLLVVLMIAGSFYMLSYSLTPENNKGRNITKMYARLYQDHPDMKPWVDSLQQAHAFHDTIIVAQDGDRHAATWIPSSSGSHRVAFLIHGYTDSYVRMLPIARIYYQMGYNVFLPDLHGNGRSEGEAQQMGWKDRLDVEEWIPIANTLFADSTGTTQMVLHGVSMGAATTMCISGDQTPSYVKCFVEDCGYTSVWDEFSEQLHEQFSLPDFPLLYTTSILCDIRYGWNFTEASPIEQVKKSTKPMLFIHGSNDSFVPTRMVYPLYKAKSGIKELWVAPGSKHARSQSDHPEEYARKVEGFVSRFVH
ncbi:cell surface hydrolase, membrane-bound [Segatella baroniae B14]|uniref:Cell surface hydrolase, membrane-bound n=3 Tax=Prevotellaceae TaxID=171552 RepID=D8DT11_9BACT|nr:cell surface hydrolase, membrane-bound [Segatella baroniae B14]SEA07315.1 hypothetical protein SAMN05216455_10372 [Segatella bryantii]